MKIRIVTFHGAHNYGAVLQAYALQNYLIKETNGDIGFHNYLLERFKYEKPKLFKVENNIKNTLKNIYTFKNRKNRYRKFVNFCDKYLNIDNNTELNKELEDTDYYIVGSDQVWNSDITEGIDSVYFLDFVKKAKKVSYAASFGKNEISREDKIKIKKFLTSFDAISVREDSGCKIVKEMGIGNVTQVMDPVFLLDASEYEKIMIFPKIEKYLLIYTLEDNKNIIEYAKIISKLLGLKIVSIGSTRNIYNSDKHFSGIGPLEFLGFIHNAEYVISNSFHTIAFSILFKRNFAYVKLKNNRGTRIESLLRTLKLNSRILEEEMGEKVITNSIEYKEVNDRLNLMISKSKEFLDKNIEKERENK